MTPDEYVAALRSNARALVTAAREAPMDAPVPSCPGWTMHDLLRHLGVHQPLEAVDVLGDEDVLRRWQDQARF
jgi:hypothetical protein